MSKEIHSICRHFFCKFTQSTVKCTLLCDISIPSSVLDQFTIITLAFYYVYWLWWLKLFLSCFGANLKDCSNPEAWSIMHYGSKFASQFIFLHWSEGKQNTNDGSILRAYPCKEAVPLRKNWLCLQTFSIQKCSK